MVLETSRIFNPAFGLFERKLSEDSTIAGIPFNEGLIVYSAWVSILHNKKIFEDPEEFRPERWEHGKMKDRQHLLSFMFSGGARGCIGKRLALLEIKVMMIKLLMRYSGLEEKGIQNGQKRAFDMKLTYEVKNSNVVLKRSIA